MDTFEPPFKAQPSLEKKEKNGSNLKVSESIFVSGNLQTSFIDCIFQNIAKVLGSRLCSSIPRFFFHDILLNH